MRLSTKLFGIVAVGGVAAIGAALISSGGVGAAFTDAVTATAQVNVGTVDCSIQSDAETTAGNSVAVNLGTIASSAADQKTATVTVNNNGSIPMRVSWTIDVTGEFFNTWQHAYLAVPQNAVVAASAHRDYTIGAHWNELTNADMGHGGTVTYTANCSDQPANLWFVKTAGATYAWADNALSFTVPANAPADSVGVEAHLALPASSAIPSAIPSFTADADSVGTPRIAVTLSDGSIFQVIGTSTTTEWGAFASAHSTAKVTDVMLVMDSSANGTSGADGLTSTSVTRSVSCFQYNSAFVFGSGC